MEKPTKSNRCAVYARVSSDKQNPLSPFDQVRKCREYAEANGLEIVESRIYMDEAVSGVGLDRPAFRSLLSVALSERRDFDVLLVDDTSRLSRSLADAVNTVQQLNYMGVRVVFPSQGIDSDSEQADVQIAVHGLVDSLYVKELAKKTHRGLESRALRGLHTGGVCYGYDSVHVGDSGAKRLKINEDEARVVVRIFDMCASGVSLKGIAKQLNSDMVKPPRSKSPSKSGTWCYTAIREMLRRELYVGEKVWNRRQFLKVPGTNKRRSRLRATAEVKRTSVPELEIVTRELWNRVQDRLRSMPTNAGNRTRLGLLSRGFTSPYLFSNLLKCGECGSNLIIATGGGKKPKYACSGYLNRGICNNKLYISRDELERVLLTKLTNDLLRPEAIALAIEEFGKQLRSGLESVSGDIAQMRTRKEKLEREIRNLATAIAESGHTKYMLAEIAIREQEIASITDRLLATNADSMEATIEELRVFVEREIKNLADLLNLNSPLAKQELHRHLKAVKMHPMGIGRSWYYEAEGSWNLLGTDENAPREEQSAQDSTEGRLRMVAGGGFEPPTFGL